MIWKSKKESKNTKVSSLEPQTISSTRSRQPGFIPKLASCRVFLHLPAAICAFIPIIRGYRPICDSKYGLAVFDVDGSLLFCSHQPD